MAWDWETVDVMDPIDIAELLDKKDDTIAALKREILAASVTVEAGGKTWATVPAIKDDLEQLRATLKNIATQKTTEELKAEGEQEYDDADFEGGYDAIIHIARRALNVPTAETV